MEMAIEIQISAEGVRHYHDQQANTIFLPTALWLRLPVWLGRGANCLSLKIGHKMKDKATKCRHRKNEAGIRNIGKGSRLLTKPQKVARKYRSESESLPLLLG